MKPDWKDAPPSFNWLAQDRDGDWYWHMTKPQPIHKDIWGLGTDCFHAMTGIPNQNWKESLEERP